MSLKIRRLLYVLFIIIFLIATPTIIAYAIGYKFNLQGAKFQKTGVFVLDTNPRGAKIFINNKPQQTFFKKYFSKEKNFIKTPAKIKNILPGEYELKLTLDGYWPWQKKLTINPGTATFVEDVNLFKNNLPLLLASGSFDEISLSPDKKYALGFKEDNVSFLNLENGIDLGEISSSTLALKTPARTIVWSPSSQRIIINQTVITPNDLNNFFSLDKIFKKNVENLKWHNRENKIYYQDKGTISYYDLTLGINKLIIKNQSLIDYLPKDNYLYTIQQSGSFTDLNIFSISDGSLVSKTSLPYSNYVFINYDHRLINLYDEKHNLLYLINHLSSASPLIESISNIKQAIWIDDNKLLYANNFEIWLFDLKDHKKTLLTRISREIIDIIWHPSNNYVIFTTDQEINIIELDNRQKRNITELIKLNKIKWTHLNKNGDSLYFYAKIGKQEGLYKLNIQ